MGVISLSAQKGLPRPAVENKMQPGDPATTHLSGYLGVRVDDCIKNRVKAQDVNHLVEPFYNKTETGRWQSEFWGKWMLSAVASYRYSGDPVLLDSIQKGINGLLGSQLPNGYIGNYSEAAQLQQWDVWGRKYSMLGLLAYYDLTGDKKVLKASGKVADHLMTQVGPGKVNIVETGNYRGMPSSTVLEPIMFLYMRTGDNRYLDFAKYIVAQWEKPDGPQLIAKALNGVPVADRFPHPNVWFGRENGQKAYEMMSCYEGLIELYKITNNPEYLKAVESTVRNILDTEINVAGSGSAFECWYHGLSRQTQPTYHTMETCVTMTWMKLCQTLLCLTGDPLYADQIEKTAYNALLASMKNDASQIAKYSPLEGQRHPGEEQCGMHINCCNANGPRAFAMLPQFAVMTGPSREVFLNLYTGFEKEIALSPKEKIKLKQVTDYPVEGTVRIKIDCDKSRAFILALRIPEWSKNNSVLVNGEKQDGIVPGSYYKMNRTWNPGDEIVLELDVRGRLITSGNYNAIVKGPVVLARDSRFGDGFVDEGARISQKDSIVNLIPVQNKPSGIWMAFTAPLMLGTDLEGDGRKLKQVSFCDFSSAGNTWAKDIRYRVWIPETLHVMNSPYQPY